MKTAIILAGGKGERLRPLTADKPKCMVEVNGRPIMELQLNWLSQSGIQRVIVCCGYLHERVCEHFGDGSKFGLDIEYSIERQPLGRGGALKRALSHIHNDEGPVLAMNGDNLTDLPLAGLANHHKYSGGMATLVTVPLHSPYGVVDCDDDDVIAFREKPVLPFRINAGIYVFEKEIQRLLPDVGDHETETFPLLAADRQLKSYHYSGFWKTVDTIKDLSDLHDAVKKLELSPLMRAV